MAEQRQHYQRGLALARQALARDPDDPAGLLWYAANLGAEALLRGKLRALPVIGDIERTLLQLERSHPAYDGAAAARSLGRLYHKAPAIISVGSSRKAADYLTRALARAPDNAGNLAYAADFFADQGDCDRAPTAAGGSLLRHPAFVQPGPEGDELPGHRPHRVARMSLRRARILFMAEAVTLAQLVRLRVLAGALDPCRYEVHFASAAFPDLVFAGLTAQRWPVRSLTPEVVARAVARGGRIYDRETLAGYLEDDLRVLRARPTGAGGG